MSTTAYGLGLAGERAQRAPPRDPPGRRSESQPHRRSARRLHARTALHRRAKAGNWVARSAARVTLLLLLGASVPPASGQDPRTALNQHLEQAQIHLDGERYALVVRELRQALAIHARIPGAYYQLGLAHWHLQDNQEAKKAFLGELEFEPPDAYSLYYLGRIALSEGNTEEAVGYFERVLAIGTILDVRARLASGYLRLRRTEQAVALLEDSVRSWPEKGEIHYLLGQAYQRIGRSAEARHEFELAERWKNKLQEDIRGLVELRVLLRDQKIAQARSTAKVLADSGDPEVMLGAATALGRSGLHREAIPILRKVLEARPRSSEAYYNLALAHASLGRPVEAVPYLRRAVDSRPEFYEARMMLGNLLAQSGDHEEAIPHLRVAVNIRPDNGKLLALLGLQYMQGRYYKEAVKSLQRAADLEPDSADLRFLLIDAHHRNHDFEHALEHAQSALARFPGLANSHYQVAWQLENMGRFEEALVHLKRAVAIDGEFAEAHRLLGEVVLRLGDAEASLGHFRQALTRAPDSLQAHAGLGKALIQLRRYEEAIPAMEAAIKAHPDHGQASLHLYLSQAYRATGRSDEARQQAEIFSRLNKERARQRDQDVERDYVPRQSAGGL